MSTPSNTPEAPSPSRRTIFRTRRSIALAMTNIVAYSGLTLMIACGEAPTGVPTALRPVDGASADRAAGAHYDTNGDGRLDKAEKDAKESAEKLAKATAKAAHDLEKAELDALKRDWEQYKQAVKKGIVTASILRCEPKPAESATKRIGPGGGTISAGANRLEIPAGALTREVEISMSVPANPLVGIEFAPHGLQFAKPVEMTISYDQCIVPAGTELGVVYVLDGWRPDQKMPSHDERGSRTIAALTDHFSGYMVSTGFVD